LKLKKNKLGCIKVKQSYVECSSHIRKTYKILKVIEDRGSFDRNSVDQNCVLSVDRNFTNQLTKFLDAFQLIESFNNEFGQLAKKN
jgi:hypothetical protein